MENNERDHKLDQWLDEALSEYSAAEPRFGLEQRVLNRIRAEEQRSRKWNLWRWMPAFGAIAAVIVAAVAVRPMLQKKEPLHQLNSQIDTYSRPTEKTDKSASTESLPQTAAPKAKPTSQLELNDTLRRTPATRQELAIVPQKEIVPQGGDRDRLISSRSPKQTDHLDAAQSDLKKAPNKTTEAAIEISREAAIDLPRTGASTPPPPPPVPAGRPEVAGGAAGGIVGGVPPTTAKAAPAPSGENELNASAQSVEVQANAPALLNGKVATDSLTSIIAKDTRRKEARAKPEPSRQDANTIEAFGVTVRFQTAPTTQQFPTPVPLSNQEKLALEAGPQLKDSAAAQHKSAKITPVEIKDLEIKPLKGLKKDK